MNHPIRSLSPLRTILLTFGVFGIGILVIPIEPAIEYKTESIVFLLTMIAFAIIGTGTSLATTTHTKKIRAPIDWIKYSRMSNGISTAGILLALLDRFLIRGVGLGMDSFEAREAIELAGTGIAGTISAYMSSFSAFGVILIWFSERFSSRPKSGQKLLAYFNLFIYISLSILLGSRSLLLVISVGHVIAISFLRKSRQQSLNFRFIFSIILSGLLMLTALIYMFRQRLDLMGISAIDSIQLSTYAYTLKPTDAALQVLRGNEFLEDFGAAAYSIVLYIFHGTYEFFYLFENLGNHHTYGSQTLWLPLKLVGLAFGISPHEDLEDISNYRSGVFNTFAGPLFVDFGWGAILASSLIYAFMAIPYRMIRKGKLEWIIPAIQCNTIIVFSPVMNILQSATGSYLLVASVTLALIAPRSVMRNK